MLPPIQHRQILQLSRPHNQLPTIQPPTTQLTIQLSNQAVDLTPKALIDRVLVIFYTPSNNRANIWYELHQPLTDDEPDELAFFRDAPDFRNVQLVELPCGDWAFTMLRQYLFDAYELLLLDQLQHSRYQPLAEACAKIRNEEIYHLRHTSSWIKRLGLGTAESHQRTQAALDELWPYAQQLFVPLPGESILIDEKIVPNLARLHESWLERVRPFLTAAQLTIPHNQIPPTKNRSDHTTHLSTLLTDMQKVARLNREAVW